MKTIFTLLTLCTLSMNVLAAQVIVKVPAERHIIIYKEICLGGRLFATAIGPEGSDKTHSVALEQVRDGTRGGHQVECFNKDER